MIDTAPIGVVADAYPLLREVDGVIAVARMEKTTRDAAEHLREGAGPRRKPPAVPYAGIPVIRNSWA